MLNYIFSANFLKICIYNLTLILLFREKFLRVLHENKMLKLQASAVGGGDENSQLLQSLLDDANTQISELQTENR